MAHSLVGIYKKRKRNTIDMISIKEKNVPKDAIDNAIEKVLRKKRERVYHKNGSISWSIEYLAFFP